VDKAQHSKLMLACVRSPQQQQQQPTYDETRNPTCASAASFSSSAARAAMLLSCSCLMCRAVSGARADAAALRCASASLRQCSASWRASCRTHNQQTNQIRTLQQGRATILVNSYATRSAFLQTYIRRPEGSCYTTSASLRQCSASWRTSCRTYCTFTITPEGSRRVNYATHKPILRLAGHETRRQLSGKYPSGPVLFLTPPPPIT
jgi:hypothetical protein